MYSCSFELFLFFALFIIRVERPINMIDMDFCCHLIMEISNSNPISKRRDLPISLIRLCTLYRKHANKIKACRDDSRKYKVKGLTFLT